MKEFREKRSDEDESECCLLKKIPVVTSSTFWNDERTMMTVIIVDTVVFFFTIAEFTFNSILLSVLLLCVTGCTVDGIFLQTFSHWHFLGGDQRPHKEVFFLLSTALASLRHDKSFPIYYIPRPLLSRVAKWAMPPPFKLPKATVYTCIYRTILTFDGYINLLVKMVRLFKVTRVLD